MAGFADSWPTPLEMLELVDAVDAKKKEVKMDSGEFKIEYKNDGMVLVKPITGYVPMGYFSDDDFKLYRG